MTLDIAIKAVWWPIDQQALDPTAVDRTQGRTAVGPTSPKVGKTNGRVDTFIPKIDWIPWRLPT